MLPQLLDILKVVLGNQFVEQAFHSGEICVAIFVEELLCGGYLGSIDGVISL